MNKNSIKRTLSFVLIAFFAIGLYVPAHADIISSTPYVSTGCTNLTTTLSFGKHDSTTAGQVTALQNFLHAHNYLSVTATGYFGSMTKAAVIKFQAENGLAADGIVGTQTRAHVFAKDCAGLTLPNSTISINPTQGRIGTTATITGSGFTSNSIVHFAIGSVPAVVGNNGTTLTFTVPETVGPFCKGDMVCPMYVMLVSNGTYNVSVENADGSMSNQVSFTVTGGQTIIPPTAQ